jgi:hypothetical protein
MNDALTVHFLILLLLLKLKKKLLERKHKIEEILLVKWEKKVDIDIISKSFF